MEYFDFIADLKYKSLLERDFEELEACVNQKLSKSAILISGSIIEAVLLEFFSHNIPEGKTISQLYRFELNDLLLEAESVQLISKKTKDLSVVIKDYRNLIHPGREIRMNETIDNETAIVSFSLVKIVLKEIRENYVKKYGYKAEDIFNKLKNDASTYSIFTKLLEKLNHYEKIRLTNMIVDDFIYNYTDSLIYQNTKYLNILKQNLERVDVLEFCKKLVREVEKGEMNVIMILFVLFGDNLDLVTVEEQELVLLYIYNTANQISAWNTKKDELLFQKLFLYLGLYLTPETMKERFFKLLTEVVRTSSYADENKRYSFYIIYNNMIINFNAEKIEKCEIFVRNSLQANVADEFYTSLNKYNELPF